MISIIRMTAQEIQKALKKRKKVSLSRTRVYIKRFGVYHLGPRQKPQQYPDDAADRILRGLGLLDNNNKEAA